MALSRVKDRICNGETSASSAVGHSLVLFLGGVTVVPVIADALTTQLAKLRGQPLFNSRGSIAERDAQEVTAEMFSNKGWGPAPSVGTRKLSASAEVALPNLNPESTGTLIALLQAGVRRCVNPAPIATHVNGGQMPMVRALLKDNSPQALFVDALLALCSSDASSKPEAFVGAPNWRTASACSHEITQAHSPSKNAALLMGTTFPHGPDGPIRCQDGAYLGKHSTVVADGQGGHSLDDYGHLRAMQTSVGLMAASIVDQIAAQGRPWRRPDEYLEQHHVTLVQLINAAAYAFKPDHEQGADGVAFTAVADFGARGVYAFGVGDCKAAVGSRVGKDAWTVNNFTPEELTPDSKTGRAILHAVGVDKLDTRAVRFAKLGKEVSRIFVMSDGVDGLLKFANSQDGKSGGSGDPDSPAVMPWSELMTDSPLHVTNRVVGALRRKADSMGHDSTDVLVGDFRKDSVKKSLAYDRINLIAISRGQDSKGRAMDTKTHASLPSKEDKEIELYAAKLRIRQGAGAVMDAQKRAEELAKEINSLYTGLVGQAASSGVNWKALDELSTQPADDQALPSKIRSVLGTLHAADEAAPQSLISKVTKYIEHQQMAEANRKIVAVVSEAAGLSPEDVAAAQAAAQSERDRFGSQPMYLTRGRDDVTFVIRDRQ